MEKIIQDRIKSNLLEAENSLDRLSKLDIENIEEIRLSKCRVDLGGARIFSLEKLSEKVGEALNDNSLSLATMKKINNTIIQKKMLDLTARLADIRSNLKSIG